MSGDPTFNVPACPVCTNIVGDPVRPFWHYAHRTSEKQGAKCYMWSGCKHAEAISDNKPRCEPAEREAVEARWETWRREAFRQRVKTWPVNKVTAFALRVGDILPRSNLPEGELLSETVSNSQI